MKPVRALCWDNFCFTLPSSCIHSSCNTPKQTSHGWEVFGKAHPNQYQSTPQLLPKHILRVCFGVCWGVLWHWWGRAFQSVLWSSQSVLWLWLGRALLRVGVPKKIQKIIENHDPPKCKKYNFALVLIEFNYI